MTEYSQHIIVHLMIIPIDDYRQHIISRLGSHSHALVGVQRLSLHGRSDGDGGDAGVEAGVSSRGRLETQRELDPREAAHGSAWISADEERDELADLHASSSSVE